MPAPSTPSSTDLSAAVAAIEQVAERAGVPVEQARDEAFVFAAAIAESAPGAARDWWIATGREPGDPGAANAAFFDAASRGRKWRGSPTALVSRLAATDRDAAGQYAAALAEVASAACTIGEPTMRVTGNATVAAAAQLGAVGTPLPGPMPIVPGTPAGQLPFPGSPGDLFPPGFQPGFSPGMIGGPWGRPSSPPAPTSAPPTDAATNGATESATSTEAASAEATKPAEPAKSVEEQLADLDAMIGLDRVKREVHQQVAMLKVDKLRSEAGLKNADVTRHLVFVGNPGTGKTTIARMVGGIYKALGLLEKGQLVEVDRSELVAGYLGQTAIKTAEACAKAYGGVLFIDEAYALSGDQYGTEAINTLVKEMEDHRGELVVIVAGYSGPMVEFIAENPGLASRFKTTIEFEDYSDDEITSILKSLAGGSDYDITSGAEQRFRAILAVTPRNTSFGNGRFARNLLEEAIGRHAVRMQDVAEPSIEDLRALTDDDFGPAPSPLALPHDQPTAPMPGTDESTDESADESADASADASAGESGDTSRPDLPEAMA